MKIRNRLSLIAWSLWLVSCGSQNVLGHKAPPAPKDKAEKEMERGEYTQAIATLEEHLKATPDDDEARTLLASAYAAEGGVLVLSLITKISSSGGGGGSPSALMDVMPEPTVAAISGLKAAVAQGDFIPVPKRSAEMNLIFGLFLSCLSLLLLKKMKQTLAAGGSLSAQDVTDLLGVLTTGASQYAGSSNPLVKGMSTLKEGIDNSPGNSDTEKLGAYVAQLG